MEMYFDIETASLDAASSGKMPHPTSSKIITAQYQFLDSAGKPTGPLQVFKEWESSEEAILKNVYRLINPHTKWEHIPVGMNLQFDLGMLRGRGVLYGIQYDEWFINNDLPRIDIKAILLGMNGFVFKNSGLDKFTKKESSGVHVPEWYWNKEYDKIMDYIRKETDEFLVFYQKLKHVLPEVRKQHGFY